MKIIAGYLKAMKLKSPPNDQHTRPTSAKVREACVNLLRNKMQSAVFLDLFAGTGAMGIEALSGGAKTCYFVEHDKRALVCLRQNLTLAKERLAKQGMSNKVTKVLPFEVGASLKKLRQYEHPDIIWADPPYAEIARWIEVFKRELGYLVKNKTQFVLEVQDNMAQYVQLDESVWRKIQQKTYGSTTIMIWEYLGEDNE